MKLTIRHLAVWLLAWSGSAWALSYSGNYQEFSRLTPLKTGAVARAFSLRREAATFTFSQGQFFICRPLGEVLGAVYFRGMGSLSYDPPLEAERYQLARLYKGSPLEREFSEALFLFSDSTQAQLEAALRESPASPAGFDPAAADYFLRYLRERKGWYYRTGLIKQMLDGRPSGSFLAGIKIRDDQPLFFEVDPLEYEEVSLMQGRSANVIGEYLDVINQFHRQADRAGRPEPLQAERQHLLVNRYDIDCRIDKKLLLAVSCRMELRSQLEGQRWVYFFLSGHTFSPMEVDSAVWGQGQKAEFYKEPENICLWVKAPQPLGQGLLCTLTVYYRGSVLDTYQNWVYVKSSTLWYPHGEYKSRAMFDATFHYPADYSFVSVGRKLAATTSGGATTSRWATDRPARNFTFNLGFFKEHRIKEKGLPQVTLLLSESAREQDQHQAMGRGYFQARGRDMKGQVGSDMVNSLSFFQQVFGPCPAGELVVCESPYSGGEAFPGMINLSTTTFQSTDDQGWDEILRAHEVAHQWWAHGVDFVSYHDQWLSEGMAHFAGLWYMQTVRKDNKLFFKQLDRMRDGLLDARNYLFSEGARAGSIWLGYRSSTADTPEDFGLLMYYKGAWVIQMLRNMMLDLNTMKEDRFIGALQDFYRSYSGRAATTEDFQAVMEKHAGRDLGWFFREWVYGDKIPEYKFSYTAVPTQEGKYKLTYRIEQTGVPNDFQMLIPLQINFGQGQMARVRVTAKGPTTQNDLLLPLKPQEVVFNPFASVLCRHETKAWRD